jgi:hypothetical protein
MRPDPTTITPACVVATARTAAQQAGARRRLARHALTEAETHAARADDAVLAGELASAQSAHESLAAARIALAVATDAEARALDQVARAERAAARAARSARLVADEAAAGTLQATAVALCAQVDACLTALDAFTAACAEANVLYARHAAPPPPAHHWASASYRGTATPFASRPVHVREVLVALFSDPTLFRDHRRAELARTAALDELLASAFRASAARLATEASDDALAPSDADDLTPAADPDTAPTLALAAEHA